MTPEERAEKLVLEHNITQTVGQKFENPGKAKRLIAEAISEAVQEETRRCAKIAADMQEVKTGETVHCGTNITWVKELSPIAAAILAPIPTCGVCGRRECAATTGGQCDE